MSATGAACDRSTLRTACAASIQVPSRRNQRCGSNSDATRREIDSFGESNPGEHLASNWHRGCLQILRGVQLNPPEPTSHKHRTRCKLRALRVDEPGITLAPQRQGLQGAAMIAAGSLRVVGVPSTGFSMHDRTGCLVGVKPGGSPGSRSACCTGRWSPADKRRFEIAVTKMPARVQGCRRNAPRCTTCH